MLKAVEALLGFVMLAALVGLLFPYKGFTRKTFGLVLAGSLAVTFALEPAGQQAQMANGTAPPSPTVKGTAPILLAAEATADREPTPHELITAKAATAIANRVSYTPADNPQTVTLIGSKAFARLNELEPGALYAVAESGSCDTVVSGAVSLTSSSRGAPIWFVDCANGNRFMVDLAEAAAGLRRFKAGDLFGRTRPQDCTKYTVDVCAAANVLARI